MEPYFSNNFAPNPPPVQQYKQQLFIDFRDYVNDIIKNDGNIEFEVLWSNGRHTTRKRTQQGTDIYGNPTYVNTVDNQAVWYDSLNIPPYEYVTQVELLGISCPTTYDENDKNENYFIVDIPEFDGVVHSSDNEGSHNKFAIVYFDSVDNNKPLKGKDFIQKICHFRPPLQSLNKIRIRFRKHKGVILNLKRNFEDSLNDKRLDGESDDVYQTRLEQLYVTELRKFSMLLEFTIKV